MEPAIKTSHSHNTLHPRDMRQVDDFGMDLDSPEEGGLYRDPFDSQFSNHSLHLDLYNPNASPSRRDRMPQFEARSATAGSVSGKDPTSRVYNLQRQDRSSTASLADFLKNTGPPDLRGPSDDMVRPVSPTKKKNGGGFLLKFAVGKNAPAPKKDDDPPSPTRSVASSTIAQTNYTAAGRKYYAIKVDYPVTDDGSVSGQRLLAESPTNDHGDTRSEVDYQAIMAMKKHHRVSSVLASEASVEYLEDKTPRTSGYSYNSRGVHSLARSSSFSEMRSSVSFRDDSSLLPADSISLRPAQVSRTKISAIPGVIQARSIPNGYDDRYRQGIGDIRSSAESFATGSVIESGSELAPSPAPPSVASNGTVELMQSLDMLDQLRKQKATDEESMISYATTRSIQQRRRAKRAATIQNGGSVDETNRSTSKHTIKHSRSTADLNNKGLPSLPPHMTQTPDEYRRARAAAVAAALSPRYTSRETSPVPSLPPPKAPNRQNSLEAYAIPEDDVLSLHSTTSATRHIRREKVKAKRQQDIDAERERRLDEAMRLLQEDVQRKREALERQERKLAAAAVGSQTPRQMRSVERLRTSPPPWAQFTLSPISTLIDSAPSARRELPSAKKYPIPDDLEVRPITSNSQHTVVTNGPITPESSTPSSPTKEEYRDLVNQPIPQFKSLPPSYPPPQPSAAQVSSKGSKPASRKIVEQQDHKEESRIQALEEQKWVLEQALRVLLNHQTGNGTAAANPLLSTLMGSTSPPPN